MATIFTYKNKTYQCTSLDKKLKRLKINKEDIDILFDGELTQNELEEKFLEITKARKDICTINLDLKLFIYKNKKTGGTLISIYSSLEEMKARDVASDKSKYDNYEKVLSE